MRTFWIIFLGTFLALGLAGVIYIIVKPELKYSDLKVKNGILLKDAEFYHVKGGKRMKLSLEYNRPRYVIGGDVYEALDEYNAERELVKGTRVSIKVRKDQTFIDYLNDDISICELKSDERYYVTLEGVNKSASSPYLLLLIWFIFFGTYFYNFWLKRGTKC